MTEGDRAHYGLGLGDLLVVRVNGSPAIAGRVISYAGPGGFAYCDHFIRYRLSHEVDPRFIAFQFRHRPVRSQVEAGMVSTAGQHTVSQRTFAAISVTVPPLAEQHRIVAEIETQFTRLDAAVATLERVKVKLKRARASVLKAAVEGRLVPTEACLARSQDRTYEPASVLLARVLMERKAKWPKGKKYVEPVKPETEGLAELPEGWVWASVEQVSSEPLSNGRSVPTREDGFPVLRLTAMGGGVLDLRERKGGAWDREDAASWLVEEGDFFVMRGNGSLKRVGSAAIAGEVRSPVAFPDTMIRLKPEREAISPRYLLCVWQGPEMRGQIERSARTTAGIHKVNQDSIVRYVLPLPPLAEQHRIVAEVDRRLSVLDALDTTVARNLRKCARLRQSILKRAFEGKLVPQEPGHPAVDAGARRANVAVPRPSP